MRKGISLAEIIIVLAILAILVVAAIGAVDPIGILNKAHDAQRKKDLDRIKISFEDYYNDKGCYPNQALVSKLINPTVCNNSKFFDFPWLRPWPCDPTSRKPYTITVGYDSNCPKWYKIETVLSNKTDKDINLGLGETVVSGEISMVPNYGVSSGNITIGQEMAKTDPYCLSLGNCYYYPQSSYCNKETSGCAGNNCYIGECSIRCKVSCCGNGCN
jgi:prepilin-type N-terminal cleavage/methylation domain-containing protein